MSVVNIRIDLTMDEVKAKLKKYIYAKAEEAINSPDFNRIIINKHRLAGFIDAMEEFGIMNDVTRKDLAEFGLQILKEVT